MACAFVPVLVGKQLSHSLSGGGKADVVYLGGDIARRCASELCICQQVSVDSRLRIALILDGNLFGLRSVDRACPSGIYGHAIEMAM